MRKLAIAVPLVLALAALAWIWMRQSQWTRPRPVIDLATIPARVTAAAPGAPNVVLLIGCSVRADQLTPWDPQLATTPFLARLAADGVQFMGTIAQAPWTKPGVTAIVTGQDPLTTGIPDPSDDGADRRVLTPDNVTLAERFHDAGYTTIGLTGNPNINGLFGFDQGFDVYVDTPTLWRDRQGKVDGADLVDDALDVVDRLRARTDLGPLYLQILFVDAHFPSTNVSAADVAAFEGVGKHTAKYRAMLRKLDGHLERLLGGLEALGMTRANTVFVFVADHGDGLNYPSERHGVGHGNYLYASTVHVPWILAGKDVPAGVHVGGTTAQVDIAPTLIELAQLDDSYRGPGLSLVPLYKAEDPVAQRVQPGRSVFADTWFHKSNRAAIYRDDRMCQKNFGEPHEKFPDACFDQSRDPKLERPFDDPELTEALIAWRAERMAEFEARGTSRADLQPEILRELRALGYVD
jgi:arylsulfatase A-like enzyme